LAEKTRDGICHNIHQEMPLGELCLRMSRGQLLASAPVNQPERNPYRIPRRFNAAID
jgi:hypothetical protein